MLQHHQPRTVPSSSSDAELTGTQSRIVGGSNAKEHDFDYFVLFGSCGGSLIARDLVLTAAHCDSVKQNQVRVGAHSRLNLDSHGTVVNIRKRLFHPDWNASTFRNDFMILQLEEAAPEDYPIVSINGDDTIPLEGQKLTVVGFGALEEHGRMPNTLQEVEIESIPHSECVSVFHYGDLVQDDLMICAGVREGGKDSCQGDSGGPLVVKKQNDTDVVVGVVSWGLGCARPVSDDTRTTG
jgi:secreted trypsin-like serine protease